MAAQSKVIDEPIEPPATKRKRAMLDEFFAWAEAHAQPSTAQALVAWDRDHNHKRLLNYDRNLEHLRDLDLLKQAWSYLTSYRSRTRLSDGSLLTLPIALQDEQGNYRIRETMSPSDVRRILREDWVNEHRAKAARITAMAFQAGWNVRVEVILKAAEKGIRAGYVEGRRQHKAGRDQRRTSRK